MIRLPSFKNYFENLDATPQTNYSLWRAIRNLKRPIINKPSLRDSTGSWARNDAIQNFNTRKAPGIDKISNKMLLNLPSKVILFIMNAVIQIRYYPTQWKISLITMIPKRDKDHTKVDAYRAPISLLPNLSKLLLC